MTAASIAPAAPSHDGADKPRTRRQADRESGPVAHRVERTVSRCYLEACSLVGSSEAYHLFDLAHLNDAETWTGKDDIALELVDDIAGRLMREATR